MKRLFRHLFLCTLLSFTAASNAVTIRLTPGFGQVDLSGQIYNQRTFTFGIDENGYSNTVWGQVRATQLIRKTYEERAVENGFGYVSYLPNSAWWLGGGAFAVSENGEFLTFIPWGQASYGLSPAIWIQGAIIGGSRHENGFEGGVGQSELNLTWIGLHNRIKIGGFVSNGNGILPGGGGVAEYKIFYNQFKFTTMACIGDFSHWIERETLLKYETPIRTQAVARCVTSLSVSPRVFLEGAVEYNQCKSPFTNILYRSKEAKSWFSSIGLGYLTAF